MRREVLTHALISTGIFILFLSGSLVAAERTTLSLDGTWDIEDSVAPDQMPAAFHHHVPVPGLAHLSVPAFPDVDQFESYENHQDRVRFNRSPGPENMDKSTVGISRQNRNYFWYRKVFKAPGRREVALLKVNKAQFGTAVWLNGKKIGEHLGCFSPGYFDLTDTLRWDVDNVLVIRTGAHPGALPPTVPAGIDGEKTHWTPGIYDSVSLRLADNPVIESVQVAPQLTPSQVVVQTVVRNYAGARSFRLVNRVEGRTAEEQVQVGADEQKTLLQRIPMPGTRLWTPESPNLYTLETSTGTDNVTTRFGMREFRFDEDLEDSTGAKGTNSPHPTGHVAVLNEYDWIWVNRDGSPTVLAIPLFRRLLGEHAGGRDFINFAAYMWAGLSEYWRAHRNYAGVLCFTYLTMSHPDAYTGDFFQDIEKLKLHPEFEEALSNAFNPVGVYLNFWQPKLAAGSAHEMAVSLVNDEYESAHGKLVVSLEAEGKELSRRETDVTVGPLGQQTYILNLPIPAEKGPCVVKATLHRSGDTGAVVSKRKSAIE